MREKPPFHRGEPLRSVPRGLTYRLPFPSTFRSDAYNSKCEYFHPVLSCLRYHGSNTEIRVSLLFLLAWYKDHRHLCFKNGTPAFEECLTFKLWLAKVYRDMLTQGWAGWHTPFTVAPWSQRQADPRDLEASLVSSRTASVNSETLSLT